MLVTPDGHDPEEHNDFISVEKTVDDTVRWLKEHRIGHLDAMYGLSFGGGMVVRFLATQEIQVDKAIIDAGTAPQFCKTHAYGFSAGTLCPRSEECQTGV